MSLTHRHPPPTITAPLTVQFTDLSSNAPTSWSWSFGDGGTSTAQNPSHQFASAGTYSVSLTADNDEGDAKKRIKLSKNLL